MKKENLFLSTIAGDAPEVARAHGLGLEIAEYCTARNMDQVFLQTHEAVLQKLDGIPNRVLHGPFNELFPCAIDPMARELARHRYRQALELARQYGARKLVLHGGYNPRIYYPCWYTEQSVLFWKEFLPEIPENMEICLENVLEEEPNMLVEILRGVDSPRLRMCLDVGHANVYSKVPVAHWLAACAPCISHFHLHNNGEDYDAHQALDQGTIDLASLLKSAQALCPGATYTLELMNAGPSVRWLSEIRVLP